MKIAQGKVRLGDDHSQVPISKWGAGFDLCVEKALSAPPWGDS
jgi:hypothetical protein